MNNSTDAVAAYAVAACPDTPVSVVSYESANTFVLALTVAGIGLIVSLTAIAAVLVVIVRRLNVLVGALRKETGVDVRKGLLDNGGKSNGAKADAAKKATGPPTTSCAEEEDEDADPV